MASGSATPASATNTPNILKRHRTPSPENVVVILPDESCFDYATPEAKKPRKPQEASKNVWNKEQTEEVINQYKLNSVELENSESNKLAIWEKIAKNINEKFSINMSAEFCTCKWRSLKNTYKKVEFSSRTEDSKKKWAHYRVMHELLKDVVKEPEVKYPAPTIFNDTPMLRATSQLGTGQPTIKIITEPTAVLSTVNPTATQEDLHFPLWFKQFFQVYRKNEETKIALMAKIKGNLTVMADRQCKALEKMNEHLSKLVKNSS